MGRYHNYNNYYDIMVSLLPHRAGQGSTQWQTQKGMRIILYFYILTQINFINHLYNYKYEQIPADEYAITKAIMIVHLHQLF